MDQPLGARPKPPPLPPKALHALLTSVEHVEDHWQLGIWQSGPSLESTLPRVTLDSGHIIGWSCVLKRIVLKTPMILFLTGVVG